MLRKEEPWMQERLRDLIHLLAFLRLAIRKLAFFWKWKVKYLTWENVTYRERTAGDVVGHSKNPGFISAQRDPNGKKYKKNKVHPNQRQNRWSPAQVHSWTRTLVSCCSVNRLCIIMPPSKKKNRISSLSHWVRGWMFIKHLFLQLHLVWFIGKIFNFNRCRWRSSSPRDSYSLIFINHLS